MYYYFSYVWAAFSETKSQIILFPLFIFPLFRMPDNIRHFIIAKQKIVVIASNHIRGTVAQSRLN